MVACGTALGRNSAWKVRKYSAWHVCSTNSSRALLSMMSVTMDSVLPRCTTGVVFHHVVDIRIENCMPCTEHVRTCQLLKAWPTQRMARKFNDQSTSGNSQPIGIHFSNLVIPGANTVAKLEMCFCHLLPSPVMDLG